MGRHDLEVDADELEKCLVGLANCEKDMEAAERDAEIYRIKKTQNIYQQRREILKKIPKFWYIVVAENDDFSEYVDAEELKFLEMIDDIYVHYKVADTDVDKLTHYRDFSITISFKDDSNKPLIDTQLVTKEFQTKVVDGEETLISQPVDVVWPKELYNIEPQAIKKKNSGKEMSKEDKKLYRRGMKSIFSWFSWTGEKPGKEFRHGEDLARLIIDDLFPYAVKYYTEAMPGVGEEDDYVDSSEGEALDLSEDEEESERKRTKLDNQ